MTKIPWRGKETKASHKVFIATKPGMCVSVDQMASTEVGFHHEDDVIVEKDTVIN